MPRFIVDINAARLAKWLRAMGYDTLLVPGADDGELMRIALHQDRILLTRDSHLVERRVVTTGQLQALLLRHDDIREQLRQVVREYRLNSDNGFSRCMRCNLPLESLPRQEARGLVPPYVFEAHEGFMRCPQCGRVYWKGTHWANMCRELEEIQEER